MQLFQILICAILINEQSGNLTNFHRPIEKYTNGQMFQLSGKCPIVYQDQYSRLMENQQLRYQTSPQRVSQLQWINRYDEGVQIAKGDSSYYGSGPSGTFQVIIALNKNPSSQPTTTPLLSNQNNYLNPPLKDTYIISTIEFIPGSKIKLTSADFQLPPVEVEYYIIEYVQLEDLGNRLKVVVVTKSGREIKIFVHFSIQEIFKHTLLAQGAKYYLGFKNQTLADYFLHETYRTILPLNEGKNNVRKYAAICTYNGHSEGLIVGHQEHLFVYLECLVAEKIHRGDNYKDNGYWIEFKTFWLGFKDRGSKKAFQFEMNTQYSKKIKHLPQWNTENKVSDFVPLEKSQDKATTSFKPERNMIHFGSLSSGQTLKSMSRPLNQQEISPQRQTENRKLAFDDIISPEKKASGELSSKHQSPNNAEWLDDLRIVEEADEYNSQKMPYQNANDENTMNGREQNSSTMRCQLDAHIKAAMKNEQKGGQMEDEREEQCYYKQNQSSFANILSSSSGHAFRRVSERYQWPARKEKRQMLGDVTELYEKTYEIPEQYLLGNNLIPFESMPSQSQRMDQQEPEQERAEYSFHSSHIHSPSSENMNSSDALREDRRELEIRQDMSSISALTDRPELRIKSVIQLSSQMVALLSQNRILTLHHRQQNEKQFKSTDINLEDGFFSHRPLKLFSSQSAKSLFFLEESNEGIFQYDITKQEHIQVATGLQYFTTFKDAKFIDMNLFSILTKHVVKLFDIRSGLIANQRMRGYQTHHYDLQVMDISGNKMVVGSEDGIVRIFDLRKMGKQSINNFDLKRQLHYRDIDFPYCHNIQIVPKNNNIFCSYNNSAYLIYSESVNNRNIHVYDQTLKMEDRMPINKYPEDLLMHSRTANHINKYSINQNGSRIVQLSDDGTQNYINLNKGSMDRPIKQDMPSVYLEYDQFSRNNLIRGYLHQNTIKFAYEQSK